MTKLRWGILGTSRIARTKVIPAMLQCPHLEVTAIASRDQAKAQSAAAEFGIAKAFDSYELLLADPEIDVIYNPLPNHLHVPWSIKALQAGKHVLCEKPLGVSAADAQLLLDESRRYPQLKVMEAFMYRFHPQWQRAKQIVQAGGIGELRAIQSFFSYFNADSRDIRNQRDIGGGGLLDIGCYGISLSRYIFEAEPQFVSGVMEHDPKFKTDRLGTGVLTFARGISTFTFSTQLTPYQRVNILGTEGRIEIPVPFNPQPEQTARLSHQSGSQIKEIQFELCNQFTLQADAFSQAILNNSEPPAALADAIANMRVLDAMIESNKTGGQAVAAPAV